MSCLLFPSPKLKADEEVRKSPFFKQVYLPKFPFLNSRRVMITDLEITVSGDKELYSLLFFTGLKAWSLVSGESGIYLCVLNSC